MLDRLCATFTDRFTMRDETTHCVRNNIRHHHR
ncbi:hypothetical protein BLA6993_02087 [Burkholderia lata]|nr:hypothetical protein BLA6993_02087 [Burkholderia lata]